MDYGNKDISEWEGSNINSYEELNGFWLSSSLKISPLQQVKVLKKYLMAKVFIVVKKLQSREKFRAVQPNNK